MHELTALSPPLARAVQPRLQLNLGSGNTSTCLPTDFSGDQPRASTVPHSLQELYSRGYGSVLDSGTTFTYLPTDAFSAFQRAVTDYALSHGLHESRGPDPKFQDTCFGGAPHVEHADRLGTVFPTFTLHFAEVGGLCCLGVWLRLLTRGSWSSHRQRLHSAEGKAGPDPSFPDTCFGERLTWSDRRG